MQSINNMDLSVPGSTNSLVTTSLTPVFGDNVQDLLNAGALNVNPSAIITVNSTADTVNDFNSGVTTLRDAINQANADSGEDLIVFDRSLFTTEKTITLSNGQLRITHNLDIIAPRDELTGEDLLTVSGNKASRVFSISQTTVSLDGLIIADGSVTGQDGGGIDSRGTLTIDNSIIRNNSAKSSGLYPAILGGRGGGINNDGILTVNNSTLIGNITSTTGPDDGGGGIFSDRTLTVQNSTITGNSAADGGGITSYGISTVINSTISGNSADSSGGGISNLGITTIQNSTISGNSAFDGGGISNFGTSTLQNSITVQNSTISGNLASSEGGGIYSADMSTIQNSTISNNSAGNGGGIYYAYYRPNINSSADMSTVENSTISGNLASRDGGGIYKFYTNTVTLLFSTVTQNQANNGGGVYLGDVQSSFNSSPGSFNVRNAIIAANLLSTNGINPDTSGTFTSNGYNLIGNSTGSTGFDEAIGDIIGTSDNPIDPRLAALDNNYGPTQTNALLSDSPAIDTGDPAVLDTDPTTDQRGFPRVINGRADIGAFEFSNV